MLFAVFIMCWSAVSIDGFIVFEISEVFTLVLRFDVLNQF